MATAVKICGITRLEDALAAAHAGAHAVGFVFYADSPRAVDPVRVREIIERLPPFITSVGLFVDHSADAVREILEHAPLQLLQFHGDETPEFCTSFGKPYIKAVRVEKGMDLLHYAARYSSARGLLLDAFVEGVHGGTGQTLDWTAIPRSLPLPIVLAGGLTPDNVETAVRTVRPWAVDVSSGVERVKGIKDADRITAFIRGVRNADV